MAPIGFRRRRHRRASLRLALLVSDILMLVLGTLVASLIRFGRVRHVQALPYFGAQRAVRRPLVRDHRRNRLCLPVVRGSLRRRPRVLGHRGVQPGRARTVPGGGRLHHGHLRAEASRLSRGWVLLVWGSGIRAGDRWARSRSRGHREQRQGATCSGPRSWSATTRRRSSSSPVCKRHVIGAGAGRVSGQLPAGHARPSDWSAGLAGVSRRRAGHREVLDERAFDTVLIASTAFDSGRPVADHHRPARLRRRHRAVLRPARRDHLARAYPRGLGRAADHDSRRHVLPRQALREADVRSGCRRSLIVLVGFRCGSCLPLMIKIDSRGSGPLPTDARRSRRKALRHVQVPLDVGRRRGAGGLSSRARTRLVDRSSRCKTIPA